MWVLSTRALVDRGLALVAARCIFSTKREQRGLPFVCCGESRSFRTQTIREDESSRTKTKTQDESQPKAIYSTVDFSKVDPLYMCRSVSFYREADGLFTFREHPRVKRIKTECARLSSGNLQLGLHVIGASWCHAANRGAFPAFITCACRGESPPSLLEILPFA
jgi:hypothetical protein